MSGALFDLTGGYRAAFINGTAWNLLNLVIAIWLVRRGSGHEDPGRRLALAAAAR
jgi:hypothetical protein